jgi:hypothetical protein
VQTLTALNINFAGFRNAAKFVVSLPSRQLRFEALRVMFNFVGEPL